MCGGSSCSRLYCAEGGAYTSNGVCAYDDGQPGIDPIYLNAGARDQKAGQTARMARELAHEAFHRLQPFGQVKITQFEEYWAFYLETQVVKASYPDFKGYDPPECEQPPEVVYEAPDGWLLEAGRLPGRASSRLSL